MSEVIKIFNKTKSFEDLNRVTMLFEQALKNFGKPDYKKKIIASLNRDNFVQKWVTIKSQILESSDIKSFEKASSELCNLYEQLLNTINAPECSDFIEWIQLNIPQKQALDKEQLEKLKRLIIRYYSSLSPDFQIVFENLKQLDDRIIFSNIRNSLLRNYANNLRQTVNEDHNETDKIEGELKTIFADMRKILEFVASLKWLQCDSFAFGNYFDFLSDEWVIKKAFIDFLYQVMNRNFKSKKMDGIYTELESRNNEFNKIIELNLSPVVTNFDGAEHIHKSWLDNLKITETDDNHIQFDVFFEDAFVELNEVLINAQSVIDSYNEFNQKEYRNLEEHLTNIQLNSDGEIKRCVETIQAFCQRIKDNSIETLEKFDHIKNWYEEIKDEFDKINNTKDKAIKETIKEIDKNIRLQKTNLHDLIKLNLNNKKSEDIRKIFSDCEDIKKTLGSVSVNLPKFIKTLSTLYNKISEFQEEFKKMMQEKLEPDDIALITELKNSDKIDTLSLLRNKHQSLERLLQYELIQIEIKPSHS